MIYSFPFLSNAPVSGVAIGGPVGATGLIRIVMLDDTSTGDTWGTGRFNLTIPFKLRQCHHGFDQKGPSPAVSCLVSSTEKSSFGVCVWAGGGGGVFVVIHTVE